VEKESDEEEEEDFNVLYQTKQKSKA